MQKFIGCSTICFLLGFTSALAEEVKSPQVGRTVDFTACPVHLGIEGGCWTAKSPEGVIYDLSGAATSPTAGQLVHVIGTVWTGATICQAGQPLKPVTISVLKTACREQGSSVRK